MTTFTRATIIASTLAATLIGAAAEAGAQTASPAAPASAASAAITEGEVKKIDREAGKLTLRHGPIVNLDMPGMTMVFRVADPKMLAPLKVGEKVRFHAEKVNGAYTVTAIEGVRR